MELQQGFFALIIGLSAGLLGGMLGLGGAVIIIPALVMLMGFSQQLAQGTTLLMLVMPVGGLAAWQYYKAGNVDVKTALILGLAFFAGGYFGARFANHVPHETLKKLFAVLLMALAVKMLFIDKTH